MKRTKTNQVATSSLKAYKFAHNLFNAGGFEDVGYSIFWYQVKNALLRNYKKNVYFRVSKNLEL